MNYTESKEAYMNYINDHKANVQQAWNTFKENVGGYKYLSNDFIVNQIDYKIKNHDSSKYSDEEFDPYRQKWYTADDEEIDYDKYSEAWNHHKAVNPHHWEHWYNTATKSYEEATYGEAERFVYLVEMLCDWIAMGMNGGLDAKVWYNENKNIIQLKDNEREMVEDMLVLFYAE
jgi:adenosyl cobinamide kinase/adenosyl cobinamide phosphate guanylyltransferase